MQDSGSRKLGNAGKIVLSQILARLQAAAGEDSVLHTGGQEIPKAHRQIEIVQLLQETARRMIAQLLQMVRISRVHSAACLFHQHLSYLRFR